MARKKQQAGPNLIGYARVSTEEQSLEMQIDALVRYGVPREHIAVEKVSGASAKRPMLDEIMTGLRPGDHLVMWRLDRMGRNTLDLLTKMDALRKSGAHFVSLTERFDTDTIMGDLFLKMSMILAEFERNLITERTRSGVKAAMARGVKIGQPPKMTPKQVLAAQRLRDRGLSIRAVAAHFDVSHSTIRNWTTGPGDKRRSPKFKRKT